MLENKRTQSIRIIDCDADPFIPNKWVVDKHKRGGQFVFNLENIRLYVSREQKNGSILGKYIWQRLKYKRILNACVLDYLLAHQEIIPEEWKEKEIYFLGTIYRYSEDPHSYGEAYIRYLKWDGKWLWDRRLLYHGRFYGKDLVPILNNA